MKFLHIGEVLEKFTAFTLMSGGTWEIEILNQNIKCTV